MMHGISLHAAMAIIIASQELELEMPIHTHDVIESLRNSFANQARNQSYHCGNKCNNNYDNFSTNFTTVVISPGSVRTP